MSYQPRIINPGNLTPQTYDQIRGNIDDIYYILNQLLQSSAQNAVALQTSGNAPTVIAGQGPQGPAGPAGPQGPQGPAGADLTDKELDGGMADSVYLISQIFNGGNASG